MNKIVMKPLSNYRDTARDLGRVWLWDNMIAALKIAQCNYMGWNFRTLAVETISLAWTE